MAAIRALVDCVVLSLQDTRVFYPCCKSCFSRIDVEQQDTTRCRCAKCGYRCLRDQVDHRYRLSLKVSRDRCIFQVTVFGTCLNPFFGIHASGLQRLVENLDGASTRSTLFKKSVEDCFIGRHFIFGIKVTGTESVPWSTGPVENGSSSKEAVHFVATQMILPTASGLEGCTVVSYYRSLLQKAAEYEQGSTDASKTSRHPAATLLLIPHYFPTSNFSDATLSASGLPSQSPQSSQYQDGTLTPTPPWQQSLGLVTSSAEQEDGCSMLDGGDEKSRQMGDISAPRRYLENHEVTEERVLSPLLSSVGRNPSSPYSSIEMTVGNTPTMITWFSPTPADHSCSTRQLAKTFLSCSVAWEDLPFSESLTEFVCGENKDFDVVGETEPHVNVKKAARNNLEISSQDKNLSHRSTCLSQSSRQITDWQMLLDITNTPASQGDRHHSSDQVYKYPIECAKKSHTRNVSSYECNEQDEKACSLSENEEEQLEGDTYNCSADLFSSSVIINMNTNRPSTHAETINTTTGACPLPSKPNKEHRRSEKVKNVTPDKRTPKSKRCNNRDCLIPGTQELDFIPPSQSTPTVKAAVVAGRESLKENSVWRMTSSHRFTQERSVWKPDKLKKYLLAQQHLSVQSRALNMESTEGVNHKCDSSDYDATVCGHVDYDVFVPPTPAAETRLNVKLRRMQTENHCSNVASSVEGQQGDGVNCKRTLLDQILTSSQTGNCDSETADEASLDGSHGYLLEDENEACDLSRDLFSDSI